MSKLQRIPISLKKSKSDTILDFPKAGINIENKYYDLSELNTLDNFYEIVSGVKTYLQGKRSASEQFLVLRNFLRIISKLSRKIDEKTMILYKNQLDANPDNTLSTKGQKYSAACNFVKYLISLDVIEDFIIPQNFENIEKKPISSFGDIARNYIENDNNFDKFDIDQISKVFSLASLEAKTLSYCLASLDLIHDKAIREIQKWEKDWDKIQEIIDNIDEFNFDKISNVIDFNKEFRVPERTLNEAFQILYSKFGNNIPAVKYWPKGMEDFFRSINWKTSRVKNVFKGIENHAGDLEVLDKAISSLSLANEKKLKEVKDYYLNSDERDPRSIELALSILFVNYGRILPDSTQWPKGIVDYLKYRGWTPNRVRAAFFPHPDTLAPCIVGLLSHPELAPNVDSVAFYCYLDSFKLSTKKGKVTVYLEKFRGKHLSRDINESDQMISLCMRHANRMLNVLKNLNRGEVKAILNQKKIPLFLQFTPNNNIYIRILDRSTLTNIVKRFLADLATEQPSILPLVQGSCTGQNFRPTIALIERLSGTGLLTIQKLLNHSHAKTTTIYTERVHTHSILLNKSKDFQQYLVDNALNGDIENRNKALKNKEFNEPVDQWLNCEAKRIWFKDHEVIAEWIAWEKAIRESEEELKFDNIVRWENYWLPRLVKFQSLISMVLEVDKRNALELANHIKLPPLS